MGNSNRAISDQDMEMYQDLTFFTRQEILAVLKKFQQLCKVKVTQKNRRSVTIPYEALKELNELKLNPFRDRIAKAFSSSDDDSLYFEDFLEMAVVLSEHAPFDLKVVYAFKVYDFNDDGLISKVDIQRIVDRLTGSKRRLKRDEMEQLMDAILQEADLDEDEALSLSEFEHVMLKCPDFNTSFRVRLY